MEKVIESVAASPCDKSTYDLYSRLASLPLSDLDFGSIMLLTGHASCCGVRMKKEQQRQAFLSKVRHER